MSPRRGRRDCLRTVGATLVALGVAGCAGGNPGRPVVEMTDSLTYEPAILRVAVGETVTWRNVGRVAHSVTAYGGRLPTGAHYFASGDSESESAARSAYPGGAIGAGEGFRFTFDVPGAHPYFCIPHERAGMTGTVEVDGG